MNLYALSGLGADQRVFDFLKLDTPLVSIDWIEPQTNESIQSYSERISEVIDTNEDFGIIGVSFGGLIAVEISKILKPKFTILISSTENKHGLRKSFRLLGKTKLIKLIPHQLFNPPRFIANWLFGAFNKKLLDNILKDTDLRFAKWCINALLTWDNTEVLKNPLIKINGDRDKLIPIKSVDNIKLIEKGEHFMIVDRAAEISNIINQEIKNYLPLA